MFFDVEPYISEDTNRPFVLVEIAGRCYWLRPDEARAVARRITAAADKAEHQARSKSAQLTLNI